MFQKTTAINKLLNLTKRIKGIQGGTSAGKTYGVLPVEIDFCIKNPMTETSVVAESVPHLKRGAMKDFKKIMIQTNRWIDAHWSASNNKYTFTNGSYIEFFSADDDAKLRGARRDRLYMNEANNMTFHAYTELASRTKGSITLDWNPTASFWFHKEIKGDDNVDFIVLTYKDNEACPESAIEFIEKAREKATTSSFWDNWYKVYGLGQIGSLEGVIFNNWSEVKSVPSEARLIGYGMDFGFTNDPTTMIACWSYNDGYIWDECIYRKGMLNSDIYNETKRFDRGHIYADSAEPKTIKELQRYGLSIQGATKGKDSIIHGIALLQEKDFKVTSSSVNLINELRNYSWSVAKDGTKLNQPQSGYDHCIDAMRYLASMKLNNKKRFSIR